MAKQKTEQETRILVHEDLNGFTGPTNAINKICHLANEVAAHYEELNIGPFTHQIFEDIIENGVLNIRIEYLSAIRAEIKRLSIINPSIQHAMTGDIDRALTPLKASIEVLRKFSAERLGYFSLQEKYKKASFINNRFTVTEDDLEVLKDEYCRIYIEDDKQKSALESLEKLVDAYNDLLDKLKPMNTSMAVKFTQSITRLDDYITMDQGKATVYKPALNYFLITTN